MAHELAKMFAARAWPESEMLIATHVDREHIHSHFIVNSVCFGNGKMLRQGLGTLARLRPISDELCARMDWLSFQDRKQRRKDLGQESTAPPPKAKAGNCGS